MSKLMDANRKLRLREFTDMDWVGIERRVLQKGEYPDKEFKQRPKVMKALVDWFFDTKLSIPEREIMGMDIIAVDPAPTQRNICSRGL